MIFPTKPLQRSVLNEDLGLYVTHECFAQTVYLLSYKRLKIKILQNLKDLMRNTKFPMVKCQWEIRRGLNDRTEQTVGGEEVKAASRFELHFFHLVSTGFVGAVKVVNYH